MATNAQIKEDFRISLRFVESKIDEIEKILLRDNILDDVQYQNWLKTYKLIYNERIANLRLYITHAILYLSGQLFIGQYILKKSETL